MYILETVKKIWNKFDEITKRWTKTHYLLLTSFVLILTYIVFGVQAENNDDPGMMQYISGFLTGKPDILPYIMGMPYTYVISRLYLLSTAIPWYGLAFVLINTGAVLIICEKCIKNNCTKENYFCFLCIYVSIFLYQLTNVQFTMVAGLAGTAAIMIIYDMNEEKKIRIFDIVLAVIFSFFSYNIRYQCGLVALGVMVYCVLGNGILLKKWSKKQIICLFSCIGIMVISALSNMIYINNTDWKEYVDLNSERSLYMDLAVIKYDENEDFYESIGWDEDIYYLTTDWCFMDDSANRENFAILNIENKKRMAENMVSVGQRIWKILSDIVEFERTLRWQIAILVGWSLWILVDFLYLIHSKGPETIRKFIYSAGFYAIALALIMYLIIFGRYNSRTVIMILSSCLLPGFRLSSINLQCIHKEKKIVGITLAMGLFILAVSGLCKQKQRPIYTYDTWNSVYEYVLKHKDCIYVGDGSMILPNDLFKTFTPGEQPTNYTFWGGWLADSPMAANYLEANGLQDLKLADMLDDNKFFVGDTAYMDYLLSYYNKRFDDVTAEVYYQTDQFTVYGFRCYNNE